MKTFSLIPVNLTVHLFVLNSQDNNLIQMINEVKIEKLNKTRFVVLLIDENLSWDKHI